MPMSRTLSACACTAATLLLAACHSMPELPASPPAASAVTLDSLAIPVSADENRTVSFTNKRSAFYYTQTHRNDHPEHAFFRGFNVAGRRIFSDYRLLVAGVALDPQTATVIVRPDALIRTYPLIVEQTVDSLIVHHVGVGGSEQERVTLAPSPVRREQQARFDAILAGTEFAKPGVPAAHPAMRQSRTP